MPPRFFAGGINHETNSFSPVPADGRRFRQTRYGRGQEILDRFRGTRSVYGGFIDATTQLGIELISTVSSFAQPSGPVPRAEFESQMAATLNDLKGALASGGVDGVLLGLHGAMVIDDLDDGEGEYLERIRELIGPHTPIAVELDLHANISHRMAEAADLIIGYDTYPHVDLYERAVELTRLLARVVDKQVSPTTSLRQIPILSHMTVQNTSCSPMADWVTLCQAIEQRPGVLAATVAGGFPYADVPDAGMSAFVVTDNDQELADRCAAELAQFAWDHRHDFQPSLMPVDAAVTYAMGRPGPILLADVADNTGAGASGDGTEILRALIAHGARSAVVVPLFDPNVVEQAASAGVGATIAATLGGKIDDLHGTPLETPAYVRAITDGWYTNFGPMSTGARTCMGTTAVLEIGGSDGIEVVCTSIQRSPHDVQMLRSVGIDPTRRQIVVVKSSVHYRADFAPLAREVLEVDAPGLASANWNRFAFRGLRRPIFPLDSEMEWFAE